MSLYRTFVLEERFGFNKMTPVTFLTDLLKGAALALLIGIPVVMLILWLMQSAGSLWWLYAWAALTAFSLLMTWAYPKFIAPLFNKFSPLEEGEVADRLNALLARTGFNSKGVFVMDGSRRSAHGNAYFTGFGKNKRIVFFDTLLKHLTPAQVEAVLAHELGHFKRKHIVKGMALSMIMTLSRFYRAGMVDGAGMVLYFTRCQPAIDLYGVVAVCTGQPGIHFFHWPAHGVVVAQARV